MKFVHSVRATDYLIFLKEWNILSQSLLACLEGPKEHLIQLLNDAKRTLRSIIDYPSKESRSTWMQPLQHRWISLGSMQKKSTFDMQILLSTKVF